MKTRFATVLVSLGMMLCSEGFAIVKVESTCRLSVTPPNQSFGSSGGHGCIRVTNGEGCSWIANSSSGWVVITAGSPGIGSGTLKYEVEANGYQTSRSATIMIEGQSVEVLQAAGGGPETRLDLSVPAGGVYLGSIPESSSPVWSGYATLGTIAAEPSGGRLNAPSQNNLYGMALFSIQQNGIVVSEAGVPASPPTLAARILVDVHQNIILNKSHGGIPGTANINTGLAMVNRGINPASLAFALRDQSGFVVAVGNGTLEPSKHRALFLNELHEIAPNFILPSDFPIVQHFGTLEITSDEPISVVGLRITTNQRGDPLLTTTPAANVSKTSGPPPKSLRPLSPSLFFPQVVDGGGYATTLYLINATDFEQTGRVVFLDPLGMPLTVHRAADSFPPASVFFYDILPGGFFMLPLDGSADVIRIGSAQVLPDIGTSTPVGAGLLSHEVAGTLITEAAFPSAVPTTHARLYIDRSNSHDTGVAISAPDGLPVNVILKAFEKDGATAVGAGVLNLSGYGQGAKFVSELVPSIPEDFTGVLDISSTTPFAALTLRSLTNSRGDFLLTMFPIADFNRPAPAPIVFPQIVEGGGYTMQFILLSSGGDANTTLSFFADDGSPLTVGKNDKNQ